MPPARGNTKCTLRPLLPSSTLQPPLPAPAFPPQYLLALAEPCAKAAGSQQPPSPGCAGPATAAAASGASGKRVRGTGSQLQYPSAYQEAVLLSQHVLP